MPNADIISGFINIQCAFWFALSSFILLVRREKEHLACKKPVPVIRKGSLLEEENMGRSG